MQNKETPEVTRQRHLRTVLECAALVDMLDELYPATSAPSVHAASCVKDEFLVRRNLIDNLRGMQQQSREGSSGLPKVLR